MRPPGYIPGRVRTTHVWSRLLAVLVIVALAGCGATAQVDAPARNATLSVPNYERMGAVSSVETRVFWDRSKSWEDPGNRTGQVASRTDAYRNASGADTVVIYTTPKKPYVGDDRILSLSALETAALATESVGVEIRGSAEGSSYRASLLETEVMVRTLTDPEGTTTEHVVRVARRGVVVVVVVSGADRSTVERVLDGVAL